MLQAYAKECEWCWKSFKPRRESQRFCCKSCSDKHHWKSLETIKDKKCAYCWKIFKPARTKIKYCCKECWYKSMQKRYTCELCGKKYRKFWCASQKYCSMECYSMLRKKKLDTLHINAIDREKKLWYKRPCQNPKLKESIKCVSKINVKYKELLEWYGFTVELEFPLWWYMYDLKIWDTLIEINPCRFHNSTRSPYHINASPKSATYHKTKTLYAIKKWYKCINVRDWTSDEELITMLNNDFVYQWEPKLHWFNCKTKNHIIDCGFDRNDMIDKWYVEIYDCWDILYC